MDQSNDTMPGLQQIPPVPTGGKNRRLKRLIIVVVVLLVVAGIGVVLYVWLSSQNAPKDDQQKPIEQVQLDPQDQPIEAAEKLIAEGDAAMAANNYQQARQKYTAAKQIYEDAKSDIRASGVETLFDIVDEQEAAYNKNIKDKNPQLPETGESE